MKPKFISVIAVVTLIFGFSFLSINYSQVLANEQGDNSSLISRAGGGEDFGTGGFDSGSSSSSFDFGNSSSAIGSVGSVGSGGGSLGCCCTFLIIVLVIVFIIIKNRKNPPGNTGSQSVNTIPGETSSSSNATNRSMLADEISSQITKLKEIDPEFDEQKFKTHIKKVFMAVQEGWTKRDQTVCRPFMAEEVYQSHQMQIDNMKKNKVINVLENIVVGSTDYARIDLGTEFHKITMKIRAAMKDYKVKEDSPDQVISGTKDQSPPFTEFWVFIRKSNLKSKVKDGIFDRKCPNCGAPIEVDVAGKCKYCDANVVNGDYDWVLSEIIQKEEWQE